MLTQSGLCVHEISADLWCLCPAASVMLSLLHSVFTPLHSFILASIRECLCAGVFVSGILTLCAFSLGHYRCNLIIAEIVCIGACSRLC